MKIRFGCILLAWFCGIFVLIQRTGILGSSPLPLGKILYMPPFLAGATLLGLCGILSCIGRGGRGKERRWLLAAGAMFLVAALWTSYLTRIDLDIVLTEGQSVAVRSDNLFAFGGYAGKLARFPQLYLKLDSLTPEFSADRKGLQRLKATFQLLVNDGSPMRSEAREMTSWPAYRHGFMVSFGTFGYAPRYVLKDGRGGELDSAFVALRLFPADKEDYFRLMSPHTYFIRYFPEGKSGDKGPLFSLRVARNKDLTLNQMVRLGDEVAFDGNRFSLAEVKHWTRFRVVRDPGYPLWILGSLLLAVGGLRQRLAGRRRSVIEAAECRDPGVA